MEGDRELKTPVSIQKGCSVPPLQKCFTCCASVKYHCPFCLPKTFKPSRRSRVKEHLENHLKQAFYLGEYTLHRCGLGCRAQPHYHCLYCLNTVTTKIDLTNHIPACIRAQQPGAASGGRPGHSDCPSRDTGLCSSRDGEGSDELVVGSDSPEVRSRPAELPVTCSSGQTRVPRCHQMVQTDLDKPQDCDEYYFMTLVKVFKKLSPQKKTGVRMTIERLLFEAAFQ